MFKDIDLKSLIEMLDPTDISVVKLKTDDFELLLSRESLAGLDATGGLSINKTGETPTSFRQPSPESDSKTSPQRSTAGQEVEEAMSSAGVVSSEKSRATLADLASFSIVESPLVGIFYRASSPGAPPFVEVGQQVEPDTTVGLLETMKVFTAVQAGRRGVVREILAENGHLVENGDPLVAIEEI